VPTGTVIAPEASKAPSPDRAAGSAVTRATLAFGAMSSEDPRTHARHCRTADRRDAAERRAGEDVVPQDVQDRGAGERQVFGVVRGTGDGEELERRLVISLDGRGDLGANTEFH
jgi:hypothetical protein